MKQWKEIGETKWMHCESDSWFNYCQKSAEHDTREVAYSEVYPEQHAIKEQVDDNF
jgi:hypothetical protein